MAGDRAAAASTRYYRLPAPAHELRRPLRARLTRYERRELCNQAEDGEYDDEEDSRGEDAASEEQVRARLALDQKRRGATSHFLEALRRKRRLAARSENLRFRELYHAPEPAAVAIAALLVAVVTLILTKSWPFY